MDRQLAAATADHRELPTRAQDGGGEFQGRRVVGEIEYGVHSHAAGLRPERVVFVIGPAGYGKTSVARLLVRCP